MQAGAQEPPSASQMLHQFHQQHLIGLANPSPLCRTARCFARPYRSSDPLPTVTYINRPVCEDEHVEAPGSVVVQGDVCANASIEAGGDVMVWGRYVSNAATCFWMHASCNCQQETASRTLVRVLPRPPSWSTSIVERDQKTRCNS